MYVLSKYIKSIKNFLVKFLIFIDEKNLCILHWRVFVFCIGVFSFHAANFIHEDLVMKIFMWSFFPDSRLDP